MVATLSPHGDAGGTLHFPSPTHIHHVDPASAFRQLRRSLSRSPSKGPAFRLVMSKSTSPSPSSPLSPSREPSHRSLSANILTSSHTLSPSPLAAPFTTGARKLRPSARKLSPMRNTPRSASIQRSPRKRTLSESKDQGNGTPRSSTGSSDDQENRMDQSESPVGDPMPDVIFKTSAHLTESNPFAPPRATARFEKGHSWSTKSSPLKRSDGIMNLDQANLGSPSRKRRSLHGGVFGADFNIFDHEAAFGGPYDLSATTSAMDIDMSGSQDQFLVLPKRTSSLRKTTLQQRHDKPSFAKSKPNPDLALDFATPGQPQSKNRFRMSLDSVLPSMPRDSPFSSQGSLPNASVHPMFQQAAKQTGSGNASQPQRHPLSRTISQSTSNSSMAEDSPTHIPVKLSEPRRAYVDFSKSLPVGAPRPGHIDGDSASQTSSGTSFATPENYKLVKPLPAAFMSTGLISKRHKNVEESQSVFGASKNTMPDTPCKRHSLAEIPSPTAPRENNFSRSHHARHSFGTPSTPFNPHATRPAPGTFGKGVSIFGSSYGPGSVPRRGSFLSINGDEDLQSPPKQGDSQSSTDFEIPPTPTKQVVAAGSTRLTPFGSSAARRESVGSGFGASVAKAHASQHEQDCKLISFGTPSGSADEDSDGTMEDSPLAALGFRSFSTMPRSFAQTRLLRNSRSPTPLGKTSLSVPALLVRRSNAKPSPLSPASPLNNRSLDLSPHTPRESMIPPDPSGLSISAHADGHARPTTALNSSASSYPPATPTAPKDYFVSFNKSTASVTPSHGSAPIEVDPVLTSRFEKVELIGTGEFSQVYRVTQKQEMKNSRSYFSIPTAKSSPKTPLPDRVWAVKKSRHAYIGPKDRQRKLQEVNTLKALGQSDHTLQLFDSWEDKNHLYIQTEFCEEGSLDLFLDQVGRKARLDDFRIWKIMLELSLGLKHIHDSGFIHLDLKPANVLITFEGVLKIADFGMATPWPAQPGIDGEGDREYIGPEILKGQFDKPGDVFALGLIMLEIAGNVMLPDNGASWQRLRTGDMTDVPSLTWSSDTSNVFRDSSGKPLSQDESIDDFYGSDSGDDDFGEPKFLRQNYHRKMKNGPFLLHRSGELAQPPHFMIDSSDPEALDNLVRWMISPQAADRPVVAQILRTAGVQWAETRRRAGATIYEGNWGPADDILADDAEMIDV